MELWWQRLKADRESAQELLRAIVAVAKDSETAAKEGITMLKGSVEKDREMQILEAIQSQDVLLQSMSLLGQQAVQDCKPHPDTLCRPDNRGYWAQKHLHLTVALQHCSQRPLPSQSPAPGTENSSTWDTSSFELYCSWYL